jgi:regulator of protease activity HflC (stomatin/prohibitin superfamily)
MCQTSEELHGVPPLKGKAMGKFIPNNEFRVVANNEGLGDGFQLWGPGWKQSYFRASQKDEGYFKTHLKRVPGSESYDLGTHYCHMANRFTVVRINNPEIGIVLEMSTNQLHVVLPGRYFIPETEFKYIGKAVWRSNAHTTHIAVVPHSSNPIVQRNAAKVKIVPVPDGAIAFVKHNGRVFTLDPSPQRPHVLSEGTEQFLNYANTNNMVASSTCNTSHIVSIPLNHYVLFTYQNQEVMLANTADTPGGGFRNLRLHLSEPEFRFNGAVHTIADKVVTGSKVTLVSLPPNEFAVIFDGDRRVRFVEGSEREMSRLLLRQPMELIETQPKNLTTYTHAVTKATRTYVNLGVWAAVQNRCSGGNVVFYPPLLKAEPYYFDGSERRFLQLVKTADNLTEFEVESFGKVSIVNLRSDELGVASLTNGVAFLNPRAQPYVFLPPFKFLRSEKKSKPYISEGDLHRVYVSPSHRAAVSKDGRYQILEQAKKMTKVGAPADDTESGSGGVWFFRSSNFDFYGPESKTSKSYQLGTHHFIRIDPGRVGSVIGRDGMKILEPGGHVLDNAAGEFFEADYPVSVDPVEVNGIQVTSKEGVKLHIDVLVTYSISDPLKTIQRFGMDHKQLEKYIADNTKAEMLRLCGGQPAIGSSKFAVGGGNTEIGAPQGGILAEQEDQIENDFKKHVALLSEEYGINVEHMKILNWSPDESFMDKMREQALQLQAQKAENSQALLMRESALLQAEADTKLAEAEKVRCKVENEKLLLQKQREVDAMSLEQEAQLKRQAAIAVAEAERNSKVKAAQAWADAEARGAQAQADADAMKAQTLAETETMRAQAEAAVDISMREAEKQKIVSEAQKATAILQAESEVAALTARKQAEAQAAMKVAETQLKAAELEARAAKIRAEARIVEARSDAESARLRGVAEAETIAALAQARLSGVPESERARVTMLQSICEGVKEQAKSVQIVQHTADPQKSAQVYESLFNNNVLWQMMGDMNGGKAGNPMMGLCPPGMGGMGMGGMGMGGMGMGMGMGGIGAAAIPMPSAHATATATAHPQHATAGAATPPVGLVAM